jgi:hypothetical protein
MARLTQLPKNRPKIGTAQTGKNENIRPGEDRG